MTARPPGSGPDAPPEPAPRPAERRARRLLGLGAAAGLALAAFALIDDGRGDAGLPPDAVARVNGELVRTETWARAVHALASDRRDPIDAADKRHVLDRLVDEELLVQRGLELGLARHDRRVRGDLVSAVIEAVVSQADAQEPDDDEVRAFYAENRGFFAQTDRLQVRDVFVRAAPQRSVEASRERAQQAVERLRAGEPFDAVARELGDPVVARLPADLLPPAKLREYLGPTATRAALALSPGEVSEPVRVPTGHRVLQVVARDAGSVPPLAEIEDVVRAELRRRAGDRALRRYLEELRARADLQVAQELP